MLEQSDQYEPSIRVRATAGTLSFLRAPSSAGANAAGALPQAPMAMPDQVLTRDAPRLALTHRPELLARS